MKSWLQHINQLAEKTILRYVAVTDRMMYTCQQIVVLSNGFLLLDSQGYWDAVKEHLNVRCAHLIASS